LVLSVLFIFTSATTSFAQNSLTCSYASEYKLPDDFVNILVDEENLQLIYFYKTPNERLLTIAQVTNQWIQAHAMGISVILNKNTGGFGMAYTSPADDGSIFGNFIHGNCNRSAF
jgi:hypothetical protein